MYGVLDKYKNVKKTFFTSTYGLSRRILALKKKHGKQLQKETVVPQKAAAHAGAGGAAAVAPASGEVNEVWYRYAIQHSLYRFRVDFAAQCYV